MLVCLLLSCFSVVLLYSWDSTSRPPKLRKFQMLSVLLIFYPFLPRLSAAMCYQCASELALVVSPSAASTRSPVLPKHLLVQNWSRYGLPRSQGDSMMADDACLDDSRVSAHVPCSAPCMTINITAVGGKHDGKVLGG